MPDWSYHPIFKPILQKLPPSFSREFIHRGMSMISSSRIGEGLIEFLGHMEPSGMHAKNLFGVHFSTPVGLSGRIDPHLSGMKAFQNLGFGFIEVGPVSIRGSSGELFMDPKLEKIHRLTDASMELMAAKEQLLSLKKKKIPLLINVEGTYQEALQICEELLPFSDGFILGSHIFQSASQFNQFKYELNKPIILSISQDDTLSLDYGPDGILLTGNASPEELIHKLSALRKLYCEELPIITSGCVKEPSDAIKLLESGASLIMLGDEYIFTGPGLPKRINEAYTSTFTKEPVEVKGWRWYWLFGLAIAVAGLIALFFSMTSVILPYDESFLGIFRKDIISFNPAILYFMAHDRMTLSGTMISGGIIYMQLARHGIRNGLHWARKAVNIAGAIGFLGIVLFIGYGYFDWLHGLFWLILLPLFILGYAKSRTASASPSSSNLFNSPQWKLSLFGQLCFVILGFSLAIGGMIISVIGASHVFVPTDLTYLCMTPEALNEFNDRLIPVIAHDRAGFGSALLSVGLLVLMLALWGIREGERWVWWTFTIGAIPAFAAGILTHFFINYTDFIHLLPAYFALVLYVIGVIATAPFLFKK